MELGSHLRIILAESVMLQDNISSEIALLSRRGIKRGVIRRIWGLLNVSYLVRWRLDGKADDRLVLFE
jgi:hypothetical protein